MNSPYRHSVWIDVAVVVGLLALLLVPLGYLASTMLGGGGGWGVVAGSGDGAPLATRGPAPRPEGATPGPVLSPGPVGDGLGINDRSGSSSDGAVPFSEDWRSSAAPDLGGASSPGRDAGGTVSGGRPGGGTTDRSGPALADRAPSGEGGSRTTPRADRQGGWHSEARRFADRTRTLGGQLRQMNETSGSRSSDTPDNADRSDEARTASGGTAQTSNDPGTPDDPNQVPIDDHLHWLAVLGILWGAWRIARGA